MSEPADLVDVVLLDVPVEQLRRAQQYHDALLRELALIDADAGPGAADAAPKRLLALVSALNRRSSMAQMQLGTALERGSARVDVTYRVPRDVASASVELGRLFDEADEYCRHGHLLTLAAPDDVVAFRRRYLEEFERQVRGAPPRRWSDP